MDSGTQLHTYINGLKYDIQREVDARTIFDPVTMVAPQNSNMTTRSNSQHLNNTITLTDAQLQDLIDKATTEAVKRALSNRTTSLPPSYSDLPTDTMKLSNMIPLFDGHSIEVEEWTFMIENIITSMGLNPTQACYAARLQLRGSALTWWHSIGELHRHRLTADGFKEAIHQHF